MDCSVFDSPNQTGKRPVTADDEEGEMILPVSGEEGSLLIPSYPDIYKVAEIDGRTCTAAEFSEAYCFLQQDDSIMDEESVHHLHKYAIYRTWIKDVIQVPDTTFFSQFQIFPNSRISQFDDYSIEWPPDSQTELEALTLMTDHFHGYAAMCDEIGNWIAAIENVTNEIEIESFSEIEFPTSHKRESNQISHSNKYHHRTGSEVLRRPLCLLIERHFSTDALRSFMDAKGETSSAWQPPPCYWAMMHIPEARETLERIFARHRKSEFLAAFVEDYVFSHKAEPLTDENLSQLTSNFRVFIHTSSRLIAKYLKEDDESELVASTDPLQLSAFFCHTENAYMYIQALLSFIPRWRPDLAGCRRLSQVLFRTMRQTRREFRVAELSLLFTNLSNYPDLHRTFLRVYRTENDGRLRLHESDVCELWSAAARVLQAFESSRVLLYERDASMAKGDSPVLSSAGAILEDELNFVETPNKLSDVVSSRKRKRESPEPHFVTLEYFPTAVDGRSPLPEQQSADVLRSKLIFCQKSAEVERWSDGPMEQNVTQPVTDGEELETFKRARMATLSDAMDKLQRTTPPVPPVHIDMPSASQVGGALWPDEYERLRETPELPPMEALRDSLLIETLLDDWINPEVLLSKKAERDYLDFLLALTTYSPYEMMASREISRAAEWREYGGYRPDDPWREDIPEIEDDDKGLEDAEYFGSLNASSALISNFPDFTSQTATEGAVWETIATSGSAEPSEVGGEERPGVTSTRSIPPPSLLESVLYRNIHDNRKLGKAISLNETDKIQLKRTHRLFERSVNEYKLRARREMIEIYSFLRSGDRPSFDLILSFVFRRISTSLSASAVLRVIELNLFSDPLNSNPLFKLDETIIFIFSKIATFHKHKRFLILQIIHRCLAEDKSDCPTQSASRLSIQRNVIDLALWMFGQGSFAGVFALLRANSRRFDLHILREALLTILSSCEPPFSRRFIASLLATLAALLTDTNGLILPKDTRLRERLVDLLNYLHSLGCLKPSGLDEIAKNIQTLSNWLRS